MAQLVNMRQRIKAIETIQKITHAMRLISMSTHSQLKRKKTALEHYQNTITNITTLVKGALPQDQASTKSSLSIKNKKKPLAILISSEKGLCGNFNIQLFKFFELNPISQKVYDIISVGKYAVDYTKIKNKPTIAEYPQFSATNFIKIADDIADFIINNQELYNKVTVYSNYPKTFFIQRPEFQTIVPINEAKANKVKSKTQTRSTEYLFEQSPQELYNFLEKLQLKTKLQELLFNSLLAEQAARFISMDNSSRNAENLLNAMKLEYNKARQAAITKELTELASSFL